MKRIFLKFSIFMSLLVPLSIIAENNQCHTISERKPFFMVDYLFWQALEDQLQYAAKIPGGVPKDGLIFAPAVCIENQKFNYNSGVRATAGLYFCEQWDSAVAWTRFNVCTCSRVHEDNTGIIATTIFGILDFNGAVGTDAQSNWCINLDAIDLELARDWNVIETVPIRTHIGLKWARINQSQVIDYGGIPSGEAETLNVNVVRCNKFWGIGPRVGIETTRQTRHCFNIIAAASTSLLFGRFNVTSKYTVSDGTILTGPTFFDNRNRIRPTIQLLLGLSKEREVCGKDLEVGIAYEMQYWWNQWQVMPTLLALLGTTLSNGDLMFHGLTARFSIKF